MVFVISSMLCSCMFNNINFHRQGAY